MISSKENVHRNVEEIGELFPLKRLCTVKHCSPSNRTEVKWYVQKFRNLGGNFKVFSEPSSILISEFTWSCSGSESDKSSVKTDLLRDSSELIYRAGKW